MDKDTNKINGIPVKKVCRNGKGWIDGRSLHQELKIKSRFHGWLNQRIKRYGFVCGDDYEILLTPRPHRRGRMLREYYFSPVMAEKLIAIEQSVRTPFDSIDTFTIGKNKLRVIIRNGEMWFLVVDICRILGIYHKHTAIDDLEKESIAVIVANIGNRHPLLHQIVNEFGLFLLFFRSKKQGAKEACKWLVNEALPQIRKAYAMPATPPSMLDRFRRFIKSLRKQPETVPAKEAQDEQP